MELTKIADDVIGIANVDSGVDEDRAKAAEDFIPSDVMGDVVSTAGDVIVDGADDNDVIADVPEVSTV